MADMSSVVGHMPAVEHLTLPWLAIAYVYVFFLLFIQCNFFHNFHDLHIFLTTVHFCVVIKHLNIQLLTLLFFGSNGLSRMIADGVPKAIRTELFAEASWNSRLLCCVH